MVGLFFSRPPRVSFSTTTITTKEWQKGTTNPSWISLQSWVWIPSAPSMFLLSNYALYLSLYGENDESKQKEAVFVKNTNNKEMKTCSERQKGQSDKDGQRRSDVMMITRRTGHSWRIKKLIGTCSDVTRRTILSNIHVSIHGLYFTNFWSFQTWDSKLSL